MARHQKYPPKCVVCCVGHVSQGLLPTNKYVAQGSCGLGLAAQKQAAVVNLWAGWVRAPVRHRVEWADLTQLVQLPNCLWDGEESSTQAMWHPPVDCLEGFPTEGQQQLSLQSLPRCLMTQHFLVCLLRLPGCWPSARAQGECLQVSESVHSPFNETSGFSVFFHLTRWPESSLIFIVIFCGNSSFWAGEPLCGAKASRSFKGASTVTLSFSLLKHHAQVWNQPPSCLCLSYRTRCGFFFISSDVHVMISQTSGDSPSCLFIIKRDELAFILPTVLTGT